VLNPVVKEGVYNVHGLPLTRRVRTLPPLAVERRGELHGRAMRIGGHPDAPGMEHCVHVAVDLAQACDVSRRQYMDDVVEQDVIGAAVHSFLLYRGTASVHYMADSDACGT
jgi:hypothetical protein